MHEVGPVIEIENLEEALLEGSRGSGKDNEFRVFLRHLGIDVHNGRSCESEAQKQYLAWR